MYLLFSNIYMIGYILSPHSPADLLGLLPLSPQGERGIVMQHINKMDTIGASPYPLICRPYGTCNIAYYLEG